MTRLRKTACPQCGADLDPISNYFAALLEGIGHRGSSFSNVDAVTHDGSTNRFLFQEFKRPLEALPSPGQRKLLCGLARLAGVTVWCVQQRSDGRLNWSDVAASQKVEVIGEEEYRARFDAWWNPPVSNLANDWIFEIPPQEPTPPPPITADDIPWGRVEEVARREQVRI